MSRPQQQSYRQSELLECGHARLFGPGNAQLPLPPMLMFDRITHISTGGGASLELLAGQCLPGIQVLPDATEGA